MNIEKAAGTMVVAVRAYVAWSLEKFASPIAARISAVERRVDAIPAPLQGERGPVGEKGMTGDRGEPGAQGEPGQPGAPGARGDAGERGDPGEPGEKGERGEKGDPGERGEPGAPGAQGERGDVGEKGMPGDRGEPGSQGERGERGIEGLPGKSAFEVAKESGFMGSEGEWLLSLKGTNGARGERGVDGQDGRPGERGDPGQNGRDALELATILNGIDETRSYQKGTAVAMLGGTFWATRKTDPLSDAGDYADAGWVCIARGVLDPGDERSEDQGRWIARTETLSDGTQFERRRKTTTVIDRGVFKSGKAYDAGDVVTYAGSAFIAQRDTKTAPETGDDWRLAVKRGKDGKDLT